jgi:hypothetical protein
MQNPDRWHPEFSILDIVGFQPDALSGSDAWVGHLHFANYIIQKVRPKVFVELGVYTGNSYLAFCKSIQQHKIPTKAFGVDSWVGDIHMGPQDEKVFTNISLENEKYSNFSNLIRKSFDDAVSGFENKSIDLLHIDGTHTYEAVKNDFETWLPKLSDSATVLFHDTNVFKSDFGVHSFWNEIKSKYPTFEFEHSNGLGVLQMPDIESTKKLPHGSSEKATEMRRFFQILGINALELFQNGVELTDLKNRLNLANQRITELERDKGEILQSNSWKITSPLRAFGSRLGR